MKHWLAGIFMVALITGCKKKVETIYPQIQAISESVYASGVVKSVNQYQVFPKNSGIISSLKIKEGDFVEKGQILFEIANPSAKLNIENAELNFENASIKSNQERLRDAVIAKDLAYQKLRTDSLLWRRQNALWQQQIGTKVDQEQRELAYHNSQTAFQSAEIRVSELRRQIKFAAEQSAKNVALAKSIASDFAVRAEVSGRIYSFSKEIGEMVSIQNPVAIIGDAKVFMLELQIDEDDITRVKIGQKVLLTLDSYDKQVFEAKVNGIDPLMNEKTRTFTVKASFIAQPQVLYPNLNVEANIITDERPKVLTIPRNYLVDEQFVLDKDGQKRAVKVGLKDFQRVEILSGITAQDAIQKPAL